MTKLAVMRWRILKYWFKTTQVFILNTMLFSSRGCQFCRPPFLLVLFFSFFSTSSPSKSHYFLWWWKTIVVDLSFWKSGTRAKKTEFSDFLSIILPPLLDFSGAQEVSSSWPHPDWIICARHYPLEGIWYYGFPGCRSLKPSGKNPLTWGKQSGIPTIVH